VSEWSGPLAGAYRTCAALARSHYENFPVASRLLPAFMRPHVAAVYAFARVADDIADEGSAPAADRRLQLCAWRERLHATVALGEPVEPADERAPILTAVAHSIRTRELPLALFDDLISAFGQDTMTVRYDSWSELLDYCRRSASPIGRLVLRIAGYRDDGLDRSSDALCTALQLTNFWQDFGRDWRAGRLYVPREVQLASGADERQLKAGPLDAAWTRALAQCVRFTRERYAKGRAVCDGVRGRMGSELRATWLGGTRILERVDELRGSLLEARPTLRAGDMPLLAWRFLRWRYTTP
jgi:phytoene synthase